MSQPPEFIEHDGMRAALVEASDLRVGDVLLLNNRLFKLEGPGSEPGSFQLFIKYEGEWKPYDKFNASNWRPWKSTRGNHDWNDGLTPNGTFMYRVATGEPEPEAQSEERLRLVLDLIVEMKG